MKRSILGSLVLLAASLSISHAQGVIQFNNYSAAGDTAAAGYTGQVMWANDSFYLGAMAGKPVMDPNVEVQLFWADGAMGSFANLEAFLAVAHAGVTTFISPGATFDGGGWYAASQNQNLDTATGPVTFAVEAWETTGPFGGPTFATSGLNGISGLWQEVAAANASSDGIQPSSFPAQFFLNGPPTMTLDTAGPEPSTFSLIVFGGSGLLIARRRKCGASSANHRH